MGFIFVNYVSSKGSMLNVGFDLCDRYVCNLYFGLNLISRF